MPLISGRRTCSEDIVPSSSNHHLNSTPSSSGPCVAIEFPSAATHTCPQAENVHLPEKEIGSYPAHYAASRLPLLESGTSAQEPIDDKLNRTALDRRISLPLLGIDLGRSGPSYGQTLKRMSVAVYGIASNAFEAQENYTAKDYDTMLQRPSLELATARPAHSLKTNSRPTDSIFVHAEEVTSPKWVSYESSSSSASVGLHGTKECGDAISPSRQPVETPVQSVFSARSKSLRSRPAGLKNERHLSARNVNLPFKTNMKYPLKGSRLEETRAANTNLQSHSDLPTAGHVQSDAYPNLKTSRHSLDLTSSSLHDQFLSQKNWHKQRQVVKELIESERRYFDLLNKIHSNYILPIQASQQTNDYQKMILSKKTTANIFSNFAAILGLSRQFLASLEALGQHQKLFDQPIPPQPLAVPLARSQERLPLPFPKTASSAAKRLNIGEILIEFLPFFKLYTTFTSDFSVSQSTLHLHSAKRGPSPAFYNLLEDCRRRGVDNGLGLAHMLLGIIQRVPRYELLIKELLKYSNETASDYRHLQSAQTMVGCVARRLEIGMTEQAATKTILTIQRAMEGLTFPLVIPSRKLVKIGQLKKLGRRGDLQDRVVFLFNDCLIYCGILKNGNVESVEKWLTQLGATFKNSDSAGSFLAGPVNVLTIKHISSSFLLPFTHGDDNSPRLIFCRKMDLHDVTTVGAVGGRKNEYSTGFQIISSAKSFVVYAKNTDEKENWISTLRETKSELLDSRRTLFIKEEVNERGNTSKSNKHVSIFEGPPSRGYSWLSLASCEADFNSAAGRKSAEKTPQKPTDQTSTVSFPTLSNCRSSGSVFNLLSPRARLYSTPSKSSIFNWKPSVNLSIPPLANQMTQILEGIQEAHAGSLAENLSPQSELTSLPQPKFSDQSQATLSNQPETPRKHFGVKYVAENYCAPVWVPDNHVHRCMGSCQAWFSVLKRRHHCRLCGGVFCSGCSSKVFVILNQEQGDQLARACEACFRSVFVEVHDGKTKQTTGEHGFYRPILSNRPHDDQDLQLRREKPHFRHAHRQSLPMDMGSEYFRHSSLANLGEDDQRRSVISAETSFGGDSASGVSKVDEITDPSNNEPISLADKHKPAPCSVSTPTPATSQTHARQRLTSLLRSSCR
ncbi:hypothetical protein PCANC_15546 [Puccinia coronata f. sp. avenae]|uniref:FYVE-type domain-containing protein n=1 Tax=Puccinia coronata f. sp. avenae TaxID=200324 RepID=A0A2N5SX91_9BASI|nr:hypothetical protein PCANC_15546 [Puccinia coronata f. sp. avenae]